MSRSLGGLLALSALVLVSACNRSATVEEYVAAPTPSVISAEPVFTGKYN